MNPPPLPHVPVAETLSQKGVKMKETYRLKLILMKSSNESATYIRLGVFTCSSITRSVTQSGTVRFQSITTTTEESWYVARIATDDDTFNTASSPVMQNALMVDLNRNLQSSTT